MATSALLPTPEAQNSEGYQTANGRKYPRLGAVISSQADSPASLLAKPDSDRDRTMTVISGRKCLELLKSSARLGLLAKTLLESLAWHSNNVTLRWKAKQILQTTTTTKTKQTALFGESSTTLNRQVIPSKHLLFQLSPSTRPTDETGSGLLRTPDTGMDRGPRTKENLHNRYHVRRMPLNLNDQIALHEKGMLPTPKTNMTTGAGQRGTGGQNLQTKTGTETGLKLQPPFVEWMMGYPQGWTDLNSPSPNTGSKD